MLPLGALKCGTKEYVYPKIASKLDKYECPECNRELILRQGNIRIHHFAHLTTIDPCNYYTKPTESAIHKNAKLLLKQLLETNIGFSIIRKCKCCQKTEVYEIPERDANSNIYIEYRFDYNGLKIADVAFIENNEIICLFEIYNTHKTDKENRPEPWFEINASALITLVNSNGNDKLTVQCVRDELCDECIEVHKCKGWGMCFVQGGASGIYYKDPNVVCLNDCKLKTCLRCKQKKPKCLFNISGDSNICVFCDSFTYNHIYLVVPYSQKDIAKGYGAQFDYECYKKWYITTDNKDKDEILKKFKKLNSPY
jgi:uncharacterized protein YkuJ